MKIIIKGNVQETCSKCGCVMEYDLNDIHEKNINTMTGFFNRMESWHIKYIICPYCGKEIEINAYCTNN